MTHPHIPLIMDTPENIVLPGDGKSKCTYPQIVTLPIVFQIFSISRVIGLKEIPISQIFSGGSGIVDLRAINGEITFLYSVESIFAVVFFMINTCSSRD